MTDKLKITQKVFDELYEIQEITEETIKVVDKDTTPENLLTEQETELDDKFHEDYPIEEEI